MTGDPSFTVKKTDVVPFDADRGAVNFPLITFHVEAACVEHSPPQISAVCEVMCKKRCRCHAEELLLSSAILRQHGVIDLGYSLVFKDVIEHGSFIDALVPADRFVEHHEEEAIE